MRVKVALSIFRSDTRKLYRAIVSGEALPRGLTPYPFIYPRDIPSIKTVKGLNPGVISKVG